VECHATRMPRGVPCDSDAAWSAMRLRCRVECHATRMPRGVPCDSDAAGCIAASKGGVSPIKFIHSSWEEDGVAHTIRTPTYMTILHSQTQNASFKAIQQRHGLHHAIMGNDWVWLLFVCSEFLGLREPGLARKY
jgi:hypothetical protein